MLGALLARSGAGTWAEVLQGWAGRVPKRVSGPIIDLFVIFIVSDIRIRVRHVSGTPCVDFQPCVQVIGNQMGRPARARPEPDMARPD